MGIFNVEEKVGDESAIQGDSKLEDEEEEAEERKVPVLVLHPGSRTLRFGVADFDAKPRTMLHAVARRRRKNGQKRRDDLTSQKRPYGDEDDVAFEACRKRLDRGIVNRKNLIELNRAGKSASKLSSMKRVFEDDVVVGDDVLNIANIDDYNVHYPFRNGSANVNGLVSGSLTGVLADLEVIWRKAVKEAIPEDEDASKYRVVLVIPALYQRRHLKRYVSLLVEDLGFSGAFVVQDHVCAAFGAGLGFACVVDIGHEKTSVSCVEDGISQSETRIRLDYGFGDVVNVFGRLLRRVGCDIDDEAALRRLAEDVVHLDTDREVGVKRHRVDDQFTAHFGEEALLAPASLFYPDLLGASSKASKSVRKMPSDPGDDPDDPHDHVYLHETSRKYTKTGLAGEKVATASSAPTAAPNNDDDVDVDEDSNIEDVKKVETLSELLPLEQAVAKSIGACPTEETRRKMFTCILLVGGGGKIPALDRYLQSKLRRVVPPAFSGDPSEVIVDAKGLEAGATTWKGAVILALMDTAKELWLEADDWKVNGQRLLREKAPFPWN